MLTNTLAFPTNMTLTVLLFLYLFVVACFFLYALFNLFHVLRFGRLDAPTYFVTGAFVAGFLFIAFVSYTYIRDIDWSKPLFTMTTPSFNNTNINTGF